MPVRSVVRIQLNYITYYSTICTIFSTFLKTDKLYFKINKMVFKTANVFDLINHHQVQYCLEGLQIQPNLPNSTRPDDDL